MENLILLFQRLLLGTTGTNGRFIGRLRLPQAILIEMITHLFLLKCINMFQFYPDGEFDFYIDNGGGVNAQCKIFRMLI